MLGSVFDLDLGLLLVLFPFVKGWRGVVRASRSADSTSVGLSYVSPIAQTRERNCWSVDALAGGGPGWTVWLFADQGFFHELRGCLVAPVDEYGAS